MKEADPLFDLIHSLTSSEKGYFKKQASGASEKTYLQLFDAINKQDEPDEEHLQKQFRQQQFGKNLSVAKQYLYESILRALRSYHRSRFTEISTEEQIIHLKVLFDKAHYEACEKLLRKAKDAAYRLEHYYQLLSLIEFEYRFNQFKLRDSNALFDEEEKIVELIANNIHVNRIYNELLMFVFKHDKAKSEDEKAAATSIMQRLTVNEQSRLSFKTRNTLYGIHFLYNYIISNDEAALEYKARTLENYLDNPSLKEANSKTYLLVLGNLLTIAYNLGKRELANRYYELMKSEHKSIPGNESLKAEQELAFGTLYYKLNELYEDGIRFIEERQESIIANEQKLSLIKLLDIYFNTCIFCFYTRDYKKALWWLNRILNNEKVEERQYIHCYSRLLQLIIHYELENVELMAPLLKSTHRYLYQRKKIYEFENIFLEYLKRISRDYYSDKKHKHFAELKSEIERLNKDPLQKASIEHFDYAGWIARKIEKTGSIK